MARMAARQRRRSSEAWTAMLNSTYDCHSPICQASSNIDADELASLGEAG